MGDVGSTPISRPRPWREGAWGHHRVRQGPSVNVESDLAPPGAELSLWDLVPALLAHDFRPRACLPPPSPAASHLRAFAPAAPSARAPILSSNRHTAQSPRPRPSVPITRPSLPKAAHATPSEGVATVSLRPPVQLWPLCNEAFFMVVASPSRDHRTGLCLTDSRLSPRYLRTVGAQ